VRRRVLLFAALLAAQGLHSIEEYMGHLWDVLPPARFISGLFSGDLSRGFLTFNIAVIVFGGLCLGGPVAHDWPSARPIVWGWILVEIVNGMGHALLTLAQRAYVPGVLTAPLLIVFAILLMRDMRQAA